MTELRQGDVITLRKSLYLKGRFGPALVAGERYLVVAAAIETQRVWEYYETYGTAYARNLCLQKLAPDGSHNPGAPLLRVTQALPEHENTFGEDLEKKGLKVVGHMAPKTVYGQLRPVSKRFGK